MHIYSIVNLQTGMLYVGKTKHDGLTRWHGHIWQLRRNKHSNHYLQRSYNIHGEAALTYNVIETCLDMAHLNAREVYYIALYRALGIPIYNYKSGGEGGNLAPESIEKMRKALTGRKNGESKLKGRTIPESQRLNIVKALTGRAVSDETREKQRISAVKRGVTEQFKAAGRAARNAIVIHTPERNAKASQSLRKFTYTLVAPDGVVFTTTSLRQFAIDHKLSCGGLCDLINGKTKHYRGWQGSKVALSHE